MGSGTHTNAEMKLYHWTKAWNLNSIMIHGLRPKREGWCVYLSPKPEGWMRLETGKREYQVLLEVETKDLRLTAFDDCKEWEVLCWGTIPPENITLTVKKEIRSHPEIANSTHNSSIQRL